VMWLATTLPGRVRRALPGSPPLAHSRPMRRASRYLLQVQAPQHSLTE